MDNYFWHFVIFTGVWLNIYDYKVNYKQVW